jgi:hypothetical protein
VASPFRFRTLRFPSLLKSFLQILTTLTPSQPLPKQPAGVSTTDRSSGFDAPISCRRSRNISSAGTNAQGIDMFDINFVSSGEEGDDALDVFDALVGIFKGPMESNRIEFKGFKIYIDQFKFNLYK